MPGNWHAGREEADGEGPCGTSPAAYFIGKAPTEKDSNKSTSAVAYFTR